VSERLTNKQRIELNNIAEKEVNRFKGDHALWHKHVHNVELDPMQILKMCEMDEHLNSLDFSCRRTGKTAVKEMYLLEFNATNMDQEGGVVAPREAQAQVNLGYHVDAIRRSPILENFINYKSGRKQLSDTYYQFANRSLARSYGIMSQVDGGDLTWASLEEVDDMPADRLFSRFLLMMGSTRRLGASKESKNDPQIRITGVFKGADTLAGLVSSGKYRNLPTVDCHLGMEMGILNKQFILDMREQLPADEYIRQLLCKNVSAKNLIWEKYLRYAIQKGVKARLQIAEPMPGVSYKKRGLISFGFDAGGHGESETASRPALVVGEFIGNCVVPLFARTWPASVDDSVVIADLVSFWGYFDPDYALGDAYGVGLLTTVNDKLFEMGLSRINRLAIGDGESTASTWPEWAFSPIRFEGMVKHQMAQATRSIFHNKNCAMPYIDDEDDSDPVVEDMRTLQRQLINMRPVATGASYSSYEMADKKLGDDLFDAFIAMVWGFATRGAGQVSTIVTVKTKTRAELLGGQDNLLLGVS
jgi:hypothetical protein